MTQKDLKAAVKKYAADAKEKSAEELQDVLFADDVSAEDAEKIISVLYPETEPEEANYFEEWECKVANGKAEKLKCVRKRVKITEQEAEVLNNGLLTGGNSYVKMYFRPE